MPHTIELINDFVVKFANANGIRPVLLFPQDPKECAEFAATALDLAERLHTSVLLMTELEVDMYTRQCAPLGMRGTTRDRHDEAHVARLVLLRKKLETAKALVPAPVERRAAAAARSGVLYFGSSSAATHEALDLLAQVHVAVDALRIRAYPFCDAIMAFIAAHEHIFVVEQHSDAPLRGMLVLEGKLNGVTLTPVLQDDGSPITAHFIFCAIAAKLCVRNVTPSNTVAQSEVC